MTISPCPPILGLDITEGSITAAFLKDGFVRILQFSGQPFHHLNQQPDAAQAFAIIQHALAQGGLPDLKVTTLALPLHWSQTEWQELMQAARRTGMGHIRILSAPSAVALNQLYWRRESDNQEMAIFDLRQDHAGWGMFFQEEGMTETLRLRDHGGLYCFKEEVLAHKEHLSQVPHLVLMARTGDVAEWVSMASRLLQVDPSRFMAVGNNDSACLAASGAFVQSAILFGMARCHVLLDATSYGYRLAVTQSMEWPVCPACGPCDTPSQTGCSVCGKPTRSTTVFMPDPHPHEHTIWEPLIPMETTIPIRKSFTILAMAGIAQAVIEGAGIDGKVFTSRIVPLPGDGIRLIELAMDVEVGHEQTISVTRHGQSGQAIQPVFPAPLPKPPLGSIPFPHPDVQIHRDEFLKFPEETAPTPQSSTLSEEEIDALMIGLEEGSIDIHETN